MSEETLIKQIQELRADIKELEEQIQAKKTKDATDVARETARLFLVIFFEPYMDEVCSIWGASPEEALRILIEEEATFGKIAKDNPADLEKFRNEPYIKKITAIASPIGNLSDEWIKDKMNVLFEVMVDLRPELAKIIAETPEGQKWFYDSLIGLRDILFGVPELNHMPQL